MPHDRLELRVAFHGGEDVLEGGDGCGSPVGASQFKYSIVFWQIRLPTPSLQGESWPEWVWGYCLFQWLPHWLVSRVLPEWPDPWFRLVLK